MSVELKFLNITTKLFSSGFDVTDRSNFTRSHNLIVVDKENRSSCGLEQFVNLGLLTSLEFGCEAIIAADSNSVPDISNILKLNPWVPSARNALRKRAVYFGEFQFGAAFTTQLGRKFLDSSKDRTILSKT